MPTLTITTTGPQAARIAAAYGAVLGLGRNATEPEVKAEVIRHLRAVVISQEQQTAIRQLTDTPFDPA